MEKLIFDSGVKSYQLGDGVLRFNPSDPNVYARFMEAAQKIQNIEAELVKKAQAVISENSTEQETGETVVRIMAEADREAKKLLNYVFGAPNDFEKLLGGVNLLAVADNGERVITNLLYALLPILQEGAERCAKAQTSAAVAAAQKNRAQRRAKK